MTAVKLRTTATRAHRSQLALTVLLGGPSREREVSLHSGEEIAVALESLGHNVLRADISPDDLTALDREADCVFIALHGSFGEDGQVQRVLESRGIAYTGSAAAACDLAMHKVRSKQRFIETGLPTPRYQVLSAADLVHAAPWTLPIVVKPVCEGSSICCSVVRDVTRFRPAVEGVIATYGEALVEEFIPGLELTVGILGDAPLPAIEIRSKGEFYDYHAKYQADDTEYLFDVPLPSDALQQLGEMSLAAHRALGLRDFSRVDWRVDLTTGRSYILEVNTIPGFTQHSLLPMAARKAGIAMPQLCQQIVDMALKRAVRPEGVA